MSAPSVSVIIPTYNRAALLAKTLSSIEEQSLPKGAIDVIVVDDGSSDESKDVAVSFERRLRLQYVYQPDLGFRVARARNLGIKLAEAGVCVFIDSGVILHGGCLAAHLAAHEKARGPLAVIGYVFAFSQESGDEAPLAELIRRHGNAGAFEALQRMPEYADLREPAYLQCGGDLSRLLAPWVFFWTCNVSVDRASLLQVGGFDENYRSWGCEDVDIGHALFAAGVPIALSREATSLHYPHPKSRAENARSSAANRRYLHAKYGVRATELLLTKRCMEVNAILADEASAARLAP